MPSVNNQVSNKGPAISRAVPALAAIERGNPALAPAVGGAYGVEHRGFGQTDNPGSLYNPYKMRVYQTNVQTIADNVYTKIAYDTIDNDTFNSFNATNAQFVVPITGFYSIAAAVTFYTAANANVTQGWVTDIYINGLFSRQGQIGKVQQGAVGVQIQVTGVVADSDVYLKQGDTVEIRFLAGMGGGTGTTTVGSGYTYFSVHLISV